MRRKRCLLLIALILVLSLLLQACAAYPALAILLESIKTISEQETEQTVETQEWTEQTVETEETEPAGELPLRSQNAGARDYLPDGTVEPIAFDDMVYERPDMEALLQSFDELTAQVEAGAGCEDILKAFYRVSDGYIDFHTMDTLANIRYYTDMTEEYYQEEYDYLEAQSPLVEERLEAFCKACAISPCKQELETAYFGEGFFDEYIDYSRYTNPEYLELTRKEEEVLAQYRQTLAEPTVVYEDKEQSYDELLAENEEDYEAYFAILEAYYDKYNPILAGYYIQLISIRKQLAETMGYDSYADYSYELEYGRDYTAADGAAYIEAIRTELVPVYRQWEASGEYMDYDVAGGAKMEKAVRQAAKKIGGEVWEAYRFMEAYDYYDIEESPKKMEASFTTYLYNWETPYLFVNAAGTTQDILTFAHEFGHYTDFYANYGADEDLETAETFSQSMEYLTLCYTGSALSEAEREKLLELKLSDTLQTFVNQAAFADFENRVYALEEWELSVDALNDIYRQVMKDYGFYNSYMDFYFSMFWVDVHHFFEAPNYVISYCISADTSLQLCRLEEESPGSGVEKYFELLDRDPEQGIQELAANAGLENPFQDGRLRELAAYFVDELSLDME